jgi:hypothetical protein
MPTNQPGRAQVEATGASLTEALTRLFRYRQARAKSFNPKAAYAELTAQHLKDIDATLLAAQAYSTAVEGCLGAAPAPFDVSGLTPDQLLAHREADPVYRLGYVRGYRRGLALGQQQNDRLLSLYAQYAILVPPPTYQPSAVILRAQRALDENSDRLRLPLEARQDLAAISANHLPSQEEQLWAS